MSNHRAFKTKGHRSLLGILSVSSRSRECQDVAQLFIHYKPTKYTDTHSQRGSFCRENGLVGLVSLRYFQTQNRALMKSDNLPGRRQRVVNFCAYQSFFAKW